MGDFKRSKRDIRFLDVIYKCGNVLAMAPSYNFEKDTIKYPLLNKIYGGLWLIFLSVATSSLIYDELNEIHELSTIFIVGLINTFFLTLEITLIILSSSLLNQQSWLRLNKNLQHVDEQLGNRSRQHDSFFGNIYCQFAATSCSFLIFDCYLCYTAYLRFPHVLYSRKFWLHQIYYLGEIYMSLLIYNLMVAFKLRYEDVNRMLEFDSFKPEKIREVRNILMFLSESVDCFNRIFGWSLVFLCGRGVLQLLESLQVTMFAMNKIFSMEEDVARSLALTHLLIFACVSVELTFVLMSSDLASSESKKTTFLCYKLQAQLKENSDERRELMWLANETAAVCARVTAADFFDIDRSTFFGILNTTATYFIVSIQFNV